MCAKVDAFIELRQFFGSKFDSLYVSRRIGISRWEARKLVDAELDDFDHRKMEVGLACLMAQRSTALDELAQLDQEVGLI